MGLFAISPSLHLLIERLTDKTSGLNPLSITSIWNGAGCYRSLCASPLLSGFICVCHSIFTRLKNQALPLILSAEMKEQRN